MSKKLLFLLLALTTLTNVSYASFPVAETQQTEIVEVITTNSTKIPNNNYSWIYSLLSFLLGILGWLFVVMLIGGAMGGSPDSDLLTIQISLLISSIGSVVLGVLSVIKKSKGYVLGILGALLGILLLSLFLTAR